MTGSTDAGSSRELLCKATADLISVDAMVDRLYDSSSPSRELIEASRAIKVALIALGEFERLYQRRSATGRRRSPDAGHLDSVRRPPSADDKVARW